MRTLATLALAACTACIPTSAPFRLYPIALETKQNPIECRFRIHFGWQTATVTAQLPGESVYSGSFSTTELATNTDMSAHWDRIYGQNYYIAKVLGSPKYFRVNMKNADDKKLILEMHQIPGGPDSPIEGVAIDSRNAIYKAGY